MNDTLKILFMGTPEFSVPMLNAIKESNYRLVGVVTAPDKPSGRGQKLSKSAVKEFAEKNDIPVYQPTNLKSEAFQKQLNELDPNLIVVVAFRMLPKVIWSYPKFGTFNLHASLLPQYRGAAPINWAIINGETQTGLTTFFIDEKIDTGKIIDNVVVNIDESDNLKDVYEKMLPKGTALVLNTIKKIETGNIKTKTQSKTNEGLKMAPKLTKDNMRLDWKGSARDIYNHVRGLSPYPLAWTTLINGGEEVNCKIAKVKCIDEAVNMPTGSFLIKNRSIYVKAGQGLIEVLEIKLSGKRLMNSQTLLNGYTILENSKMV
jgi:methionyl-tRNA formyltransferase